MSSPAPLTPSHTPKMVTLATLTLPIPSMQLLPVLNSGIGAKLSSTITRGSGSGETIVPKGAVLKKVGDVRCKSMRTSDIITLCREGSDEGKSVTFEIKKLSR